MLHTVELPGMRLVSEANVRQHWSRKAKRAKSYRSVVCMALGPPWKGGLPVSILIVRYGPRKLDDDNLVRACKAVRDGVADWLGIDDGDAQLRWTYAQFTDKVYGVRITVKEERMWNNKYLIDFPSVYTSGTYVYRYATRTEATDWLAANAGKIKARLTKESAVEVVWALSNFRYPLFEEGGADLLPGDEALVVIPSVQQDGPGPGRDLSFGFLSRTC